MPAKKKVKTIKVEKKKLNSQMTQSEKYKIEKEKLELEREKWDHKKRKEGRAGFLGLVVGLPIFIIIVTFTIIWIKLLVSK